MDFNGSSLKEFSKVDVPIPTLFAIGKIKSQVGIGMAVELEPKAKSGSRKNIVKVSFWIRVALKIGKHNATKESMRCDVEAILSFGVEPMSAPEPICEVPASGTAAGIFKGGR